MQTVPNRQSPTPVSVPAQRVVAVRFCPLLFACSSAASSAPSPRADDACAGDGSGSAAGPFAELPYRMVFAVATMEGVALYDTEGGGAPAGAPLALVGQLHCEAAPITDLAWSCDGARLAVSSYDGDPPNPTVIPKNPSGGGALLPPLGCTRPCGSSSPASVRAHVVPGICHISATANA